MLAESLALSAVLFTIGVVGVLTRRNAIIIFMCVELMLNAVNLTFVALRARSTASTGQVFVFFVMTVAAAEAAVGLAIIIAIFRHRQTVNLEEHQSAERLMLLPGMPRPRARTRSRARIAEWVWLVPLLPLLGFVINGCCR